MTKILLLGSRGRLGAALAKCWSSDHDLEAVSRAEVDVSDLEALTSFLKSRDFDVLVNCTGATSLEQCEDQPDLARRVNAHAPEIMAKLSAEKGARLIHFGTDYVFDGKASSPYSEEDPAIPVSEYGRTKLDGEMAVISASPHHLSVRVSWVFGPEKPSFVDMILKRAMENEHVEAVGDKFSSPAYTEDIGKWMTPFLEPGAPGGLHHACNSGTCSWAEFGQEALCIAEELGWPLQTKTVHAIPLSTMTAFRAVRPIYTVMDCRKLAGFLGYEPRPWQQALRDYIKMTKSGGNK